jgi:hypothetical protein
MQWVIENWVLVLFGGGMLAMHLFGHGHGHKGGRHGSGQTPDDQAGDAGPQNIEPSGDDRNA